jgi:hypothetical protein
MKSNGISFTTILFLVFLILKLTNTIDWSWWWVTSPLWIGVVIWVILSIILIICDYYIRKW